MTEEADERFIDLRHEPAEPRRQFDRALRLRRLGKLEQMGLATEHAPGVWELSERMEPTLRELGERGDIIRNMHKALKADGLERDPMTFQQIGREHVCNPVTNAHLVCRLMIEKKKNMEVHE